jgi:cell division protein FtsB
VSDFKKRQSKSAQYVELAKGAGAILALAAVAFLAGRAALDMYGKFAAAAAARADAEAQLAELQERYTSVKAQVDALNSPRGVEAVVRERYGVARPGEGEIDIALEASSSVTQAPKQGLWDKLWHLLFVW